ncbi:MAG: hypothetical protein ACYTXY_30815 [Nostoc sp.]
MDIEVQDSDVIEKDEDTAEEDRSDNGGLYPYDPTKADIDIREDPQTVFELMRKYDHKKLIIDPDFQRKLVWKPEQKVNLLNQSSSTWERILPVPPLLTMPKSTLSLSTSGLYKE